MSIFKNENEKNYVGGRKHWTDVIKNRSAGDVIFYKCLEEDFNTNSTLIVMPGEEAFFVKDGEIVTKFSNGTYKLSTKNYPILSRFKNMFSGGVSTFNCVVYFVRKTISHEILWGTDTPIVLRDKILNILTKIRARGSYKIEVENCEKILKFFIARNVQFSSMQTIDSFFVTQFQGQIKNYLAKNIADSNFELIELSTKTDVFSNEINPILDDEFKKIGLKCLNFTVASIDVEDSELRREYDKIGMDVYRKKMEASANKQVIEILGDDWEKQQKVEILKSAAANSGTGGVGVGLVAGLSSAKELSNLDNNNDIEAKLEKLKSLFDKNLITEEEYLSKKSELLKKI